MKATQQLHDAGQSLWLDNITRGKLTSGMLRRYVFKYSITGLTSNPTIYDHGAAGVWAGPGEHDRVDKDEVYDRLESTDGTYFYRLTLAPGEVPFAWDYQYPIRGSPSNRAGASVPPQRARTRSLRPALCGRL